MGTGVTTIPSTAGVPQAARRAIRNDARNVTGIEMPRNLSMSIPPLGVGAGRFLRLKQGNTLFQPQEKIKEPYNK
jgi:hypothetical protein